MFLMKLIASLLLTMSLVGAAETSSLWGSHGEAWDPAGRLPDVSRAGYRDGDHPLPTLPVTANVHDFGACGDGVTDDTDAFLQAIAATPAGALFIPAGHYRIAQRLFLGRSSLVLRGEGRDATILDFTRSLTDLKPNPSVTRTGTPTSNYSWSGGLITVTAKVPTPTSYPIAAAAELGSTRLVLVSTTGLTVGQRLELQVRDDAAMSLSRWIYDGDLEDTKLLARQKATQIVTLTTIDATSGEVTVDRPLRFPVREAWTPALVDISQRIHDVGIEHLTCQFPPTPYLGHFTETGFNAIDIGPNVVDCWVRNVLIRHAESGIFLHGSHCTVLDVELRSDKPLDREGCNGHHGISVTGADNLITGFTFSQPFIHDLSVQNATCSGNVFSSGSGVNLNLDHHKEGPFANVFTNLEAGLGSRIWNSGGGPHLGRHSGTRETFWNINASTALALPPERWGAPGMNLVGLPLQLPDPTLPLPFHVEVVTTGTIIPIDLHRAQVERRRSSISP